jgi:hypothetical protein
MAVLFGVVAVSHRPAGWALQSIGASIVIVMPASLFPVLVAVHITLAVGLFLPSVLLPFALRAHRPATASGSGVVQSLLWLQSHGTTVLGTGLVLTGAAMIAILGPQLLGRPWLLAALAIYAANLGLAFFVQRPNMRRLVGISAVGNNTVWQERARRQRYVSYAMAGLVGVIGFLMSTKPELW